MSTDLVVVFHSRVDSLRLCLDSAVVANQAGFAVILVDVSASGSAAAVAAEFGIRYLPAPENRGYSWALNTGASLSEADQLIFSNADVLFEPGCLHLLALAAEADGLYAPVQLDLDTLQLSENTILAADRMASLAKWLGIGRRRRVRSSLLDELRSPVPQGSLTLPVGLALSGACVAMNRATLDALGGWDEDYFMYYEDIDLSMRVHELGLPVTVVATARMLHEGGWKTVRTRPTLRSAALVSERLWWAKHSFGPAWAIVTLQKSGIVLRRLFRG